MSGTTKPNGLHHLAIATADIKAQIEFFSDVLGMELVALWVQRRRPHVPVIAVSGVVDIFREHERNAIFTALMPKPVRRAELLQQVERVLARQLRRA